MIRLTADWKPGEHHPQVGEFVADVEIDGEPCRLKLVDHVAPSGNHYRNVSVGGAPYQGRGKTLDLEINGVELRLEWRGGNRPKFPRRPTHAYYRREDLSPVQMARLRGRKPARQPEPEPQPSPAPAPAGPEVNPLRAVRGRWRRGWRFWVLKIESGVPWIRKVTMKGDTHVRCRGEGGPILNGPVWIGRYPVSFSPHKSGNFFFANVDPETGRSIRAQ